MTSAPNSNPEMQLLVRMNKGLLLYAQSDYAGTAHPRGDRRSVPCMGGFCTWPGSCAGEFGLDEGSLVRCSLAVEVAVLFYLALTEAPYLQVLLQSSMQSALPRLRMPRLRTTKPFACCTPEPLPMQCRQVAFFSSPYLLACGMTAPHCLA